MPAHQRHAPHAGGDATMISRQPGAACRRRRPGHGLFAPTAYDLRSRLAAGANV
jgi:hypothetical protein